MHLSPLHLKLLLQAYSIRDVWPFDHALMREYTDQLEKLGLIEPVNYDWQWETTPKGTAHIKQILNLPLPVQAWAGADGKVIEV